MIQAHELRIGNWVLDSDRDNPYFHQVVRIETKEYTEWDSGNEFNIVCLLEGTKDSYFEMIPSPIPLTEEWLLRFGFEKNEWYGLLVSGGKDISRFDYYKDSTSIRVSLSDDVCQKGVHWFQNWYYFETGEELEIK